MLSAALCVVSLLGGWVSGRGNQDMAQVQLGAGVVLGAVCLPARQLLAANGDTAANTRCCTSEIIISLRIWLR